MTRFGPDHNTLQNPEPFNTIVETAMREDAAYFAARPSARHYVRSLRAGEFWPLCDPPAGSLVIVTPLAPGVRARHVLLDPHVDIQTGGAS